jgi:hypothetical protein
MSRSFLLAAVLWAAFVWPVSALADRIEAEGVAPMDGGRAAARQAALQDAIQQAAITQGARISSTEQLARGTYAQSGRVDAAQPLQGDVEVLNEYEQNGLYHVHIAVNNPVGNKSKAKADATRAKAEPCCSCQQGQLLKRRLVATYFSVERPATAGDLSNLPIFFPSEFARRLGGNTGFSVRNAGNISVLPAGVQDPAAGGEVAREIGRREDAQFVLAGRVTDTSPRTSRTSFTALEHNPEYHGSLYYDGPLANFLGGNLHKEARLRQLEFDVWVYDALSGALLLNQHFAGTANVARGPVGFGAAEFDPLGSNGFWQSDYGRLFDQLLKQAVSSVDQQLACIPYTARVARVDGGTRLYLDGGGLDGLQVGDSLMIYKPSPLITLRSAGSGRELGVPETLIGDAVVVQVQPQFAIAETRNARQQVGVGDMLRFTSRR